MESNRTGRYKKDTEDIIAILGSENYRIISTYLDLKKRINDPVNLSLFSDMNNMIENLKKEYEEYEHQVEEILNKEAVRSKSLEYENK